MPDTPITPVMILNYGGWDDVIPLSRKLLAEGHVVWVIDNGSPTDRSAELLNASPDVHYIPLGHNWGWAGGYNRAIERARAAGVELAFLLNADGVPEQGAIDRALDALASKPNAAAVGSAMLTHGGARVFFDGQFHYDEVAASDLPGELITADRIHGGGFALRLPAFDKVGPFYEPYFLYHEESEWCARAKRAGLEFYCDPRSRVLHEGRGYDLNSNSEFYLTRNRYLARRRGYPLDSDSKSLSRLVTADLRAAKDRPAVAAAILDGAIDGLFRRTGKRPESVRSQSRRRVGKVILKAFSLPARLRARFQ